MWKRDESVKPAVPPAQSDQSTSAAPAAADPRKRAGDQVTIGKSVLVKGELSGSEDLVIDGLVEGRIDLPGNLLTIGVNGRVRAEVSAKVVVVFGEIHGNVVASEKVEIRDQGSVNGDISAPRIAIAEGAHFRGSVDMQRSAPKVAEAPRPPVAAPVVGPPAFELGKKTGV